MPWSVKQLALWPGFVLKRPQIRTPENCRKVINCNKKVAAITIIDCCPDTNYFVLVADIFYHFQFISLNNHMCHWSKQGIQWYMVYGHPSHYGNPHNGHIYIYPYGVMAIHQDRTYNPTLHIL